MLWVSTANCRDVCWLKSEIFCVQYELRHVPVIDLDNWAVSTQRQLVESTMTMHHPCSLNSTTRNCVCHFVSHAWVAYTNHHVRNLRRVGHWAEQIECGWNPKFFSRWSSMSKCRMELWSEAKTHTGLLYTARYACAFQIDLDTESLKNIGSSTLRRCSTVAVLANWHTGTCNHKCGHGGDVDRMRLVPSSANNVDCVR